MNNIDELHELSRDRAKIWLADIMSHPQFKSLPSDAEKIGALIEMAIMFSSSMTVMITKEGEPMKAKLVLLDIIYKEAKARIKDTEKNKS